MRNFVTRVVNFVAEQPLRTIEMVTGAVIAVDGLYVTSAFYEYASTSPLYESPEDTILRKVIGISYFLLGLIAVIASSRGNEPKTRRVAAMSLFLLFIFSALHRAFTLGIHPSGWVFNALIAGIFAVDWLHTSKWLLKE